MSQINKKMILATIILMDFLSGMEFDLFVPSFPALQTQFNLSPSWVSALLSINFIGYCLGLFFIGDLSDRYGRKAIIEWGLLTFIIGSLMCLWPFSYYFLLVGRFFQGLGIAAPAILSFLIIADAYPIKEQQFLMAMLNGSMNIAVASAPVIGSYLTLYFHWQGNFTALLILGLIVFIMTKLFIPKHQTENSSMTTSTSGIRGYLEIVRCKPLLILSIYLLASIIPYWIFVGMSPLLYMQVFGVSLKHFGYYQGILAFVFAIGSIAYGFFIRKTSYSSLSMLTVAWYILIASLIAFTLAIISHSTNPLFITASMLIFVIGQIIPTTILFPVCVNFLPHAKGRISAVLQGGRLLLTALSLQITSYFYDNSFYYIGLSLLVFIIATIVSQVLLSREPEIVKRI